MSKRFIKLIISERTEWLLTNYPNAFLLLTIIALRARRYNGHIDSREIGDAHIGDCEACGLTEQQYRTAKQKLVDFNFIKIKETNRTRKKSTTGATTKGTLVSLLNSDVWDINPELSNDSNNVRATSEQRRTRNEETKEASSFYKKETNKEKKLSRSFFRSPLSSKDEIEAFMAYCTTHKLDLSEKDFESWVNNHSSAKIIANLQLLLEQKNKVKTSHSRWMQTALDKDYAGMKKNIEINRIFAEDFKFKNNWHSLTILKQYCRDENTGNDYQFSLAPENFQSMLVSKSQQMAFI